MKKLVFVMAGFAMFLFSGALHAQSQGGVNAKVENNKPQMSAKSHANAQKHEKMKTQGNDAKLQASSNNAKGGDLVKPKPKPKPKKESKPKKSAK